MIPVDWNELIRHIDKSLPGRGLWMQCVPVFDEDSPTESGVGLAIQKEYGPGTNWYTVVFFSVVPDPDALADDGDFLPGRGEETADWNIEAGYQGDFDTLEEAIREAKALAEHLPISPIFGTRERLLDILDKVKDPDEDLQQSA
ncbi:MAG: hypothetical protein AB1425_16405 [Actinomycetota bacterium]